MHEHGKQPDILPVEYRNYKEERRGRQVPFRPSTLGAIHYQPVPMCDHKFVPGLEPRHRNCESCWFTFFQVHGELTQACDEVFSKFGEAGLRELRPAKFVKNFTRFMSTIAQWKKIADAAKEETHEDSITTATGSNGDDSSGIPGDGTSGRDLPEAQASLF